MVFEFDIDGTLLTQGSPGKYETCKPLPGAVEIVNNLYDLGHTIILNTARHWKYFDLTYNSMKQMGFKFHSLIMGKINATIICDDRAVSSIKELTPELFEKLCPKSENEYETAGKIKEDINKIKIKLATITGRDK